MTEILSVLFDVAVLLSLLVGVFAVNVVRQL